MRQPAYGMKRASAEALFIKLVALLFFVFLSCIWSLGSGSTFVGFRSLGAFLFRGFGNGFRLITTSVFIGSLQGTRLKDCGYAVMFFGLDNHTFGGFEVGNG